jgi:hypothetical protein
VLGDGLEARTGVDELGEFVSGQVARTCSVRFTSATVRSSSSRVTVIDERGHPGQRRLEAW